MNRIQFSKGNQKLFLENVKNNVDAPSLRSLLQYGISTNYTALKNYVTERRCLPQNLFEELCLLAHINQENLSFEIKKETWGQIIGGKKSKRTKSKPLKVLKK